MPTFRFLPLLAVFLTGGYAYHTATNVSESDIAAYHKLAQELGGFNVFPGDIVAVSSDGLSAQRICAVNTDSKHMDRIPIDATYVNSLSRILPSYQDVWALLRGAFTDGVRDATDRIAFQGQLRALSDDAPHAGLSESCECAMAERVARRERVCTVHGSLVDRGSEMVRAVQFKTYANFVTPEAFAACGLPRPAKAEPGVQPCNTANLPWTVLLRHDLDLIEIETRPQDDRLASTGSR